MRQRKQPDSPEVAPEDLRSRGVERWARRTLRPWIELARRTSASVNTGTGPWMQRFTSSGPIHLSGGVASSVAKSSETKLAICAPIVRAVPGPVSSLTMLNKASEPRKRRHTVPKCSMAGPYLGRRTGWSAMNCTQGAMSSGAPGDSESCITRPKGGLLGHLFIPLKGVLSTTIGALHSPRAPPVGATLNQLSAGTINEGSPTVERRRKDDCEYTTRFPRPGFLRVETARTTYSQLGDIYAILPVTFCGESVPGARSSVAAAVARWAEGTGV